jgi:amidophosphoribosyltransferase
MPGILGIYPFGKGREYWNTSRFIYYGLKALQGRGQEAASIATYRDAEGLHVDEGEGLVDEIYGEERLAGFKGFLGLGQVTPIERDFAVHVKEPEELILVGDGKPLLDGDKVASYRIFAERLSKELHDSRDPIEAAIRLIGDTMGGYSFLCLTERQEMIGGRDPYGVKPLEMGSFGFDFGGIASESCAFDVLGMEHSPDYVKPGEVVALDPYSVERRRIQGSSETAHCTFEYVYLARPDSIINGIPVYEVRRRVGESLAREEPVEGDVVVGVPETAIPFAMAYSKATDIPVEMGFVRTGKRVRSAIKPTQFERLMGIQLKLNPIRESIDDKRVILIDDSVVRGNTTKNTVSHMKRKGAREVHVRIGSPHLTAPCPFGTEVPPRDELIGGALSEEEIASIIGANSFKYLSIDGLCESIGLPRRRLCLGCWTGSYPGGCS